MSDEPSDSLVPTKRQLYYRANRDKIIARSKARYVLHREEVIAYQQARYRKDPEKHRAYDRRREKTPRGRVIRVAAAKRRTVRCANPIMQCSLARLVTSVIFQQRDIYNAITGVTHHVDHIVPLCLGGEHVPWNLRVITAAENLARRRSVRR